MERTVNVLNYSHTPPQVLGTLILTADGQVSVTGVTGRLQEHLATGIFDHKNKTMITPADGVKFLDAVLREFSGSYVRAVEVRAVEA